MVAQLEEEVDLFEGDTVTIVEKVDKNFFRGTSRGKCGIFPSAFVQIIEESQILQPSTTTEYKTEKMVPNYSFDQNEFAQVDKSRYIKILYKSYLSLFF